MKNKYMNRSHISEAKFREVVRLFSVDLDATQIAKITKLNRNTVNTILSCTGYKHHYRVKHSDDVFSNGKAHISSDVQMFV